MSKNSGSGTVAIRRGFLRVHVPLFLTEQGEVIRERGMWHDLGEFVTAVVVVGSRRLAGKRSGQVACRASRRHVQPCPGELETELEPRTRHLWMKTGRIVLLAIGVFAGLASVAVAQGVAESKTADPRVAAALEAAKLPYSLDGGDFRLDFEVDAARSQRVWVASSTARLDQLEIRDVWSVASRGPGIPPAELAQQLLKENARLILGAWQVNQGPDQYLVVFSAPVSANADAVTLQEVIEVVVASTDRIEKELTGKDEF